MNYGSQIYNFMENHVYSPKIVQNSINTILSLDLNHTGVKETEKNIDQRKLHSLVRF